MLEDYAPATPSTSPPTVLLADGSLNLSWCCGQPWVSWWQALSELLHSKVVGASEDARGFIATGMSRQGVLMSEDARDRYVCFMTRPLLDKVVESCSTSGRTCSWQANYGSSGEVTIGGSVFFVRPSHKALSAEARLVGRLSVCSDGHSFLERRP